MRSLPDSPNIWSSPSPPVRTSFSLPPNRKSFPPLPSSVSLPLWPKSMSLPEPPVIVSLPAPPKRFARGSAPCASVSVMMSLPPWPKTCISAVLATVGVPPLTGTAPPLIRICPAALRLRSMVLLRASPSTERVPLAGVNVAVTAWMENSLPSTCSPRARASRNCCQVFLMLCSYAEWLKGRTMGVITARAWHGSRRAPGVSRGTRPGCGPGW